MGTNLHIVEELIQVAKVIAVEEARRRQQAFQFALDETRLHGGAAFVVRNEADVLLRAFLPPLDGLAISGGEKSAGDRQREGAEICFCLLTLSTPAGIDAAASAVE